MAFETEKEVWESYDAAPRVLTPETIAEIPWSEVSKHPLSKDVAQTIVYMRDVESFTPGFAKGAMGTPSGKDRYISRFMEDRWLPEELTHADLLDRFLQEAGLPTDGKYYENLQNNLPGAYQLRTACRNMVANALGENFLPIHMAYGAVQEYSTLAGYQRLSELAGHPVLTHILDRCKPYGLP